MYPSTIKARSNNDKSKRHISFNFMHISRESQYKIRKYRLLYLLLILPIIYYIVFCYTPMFGILIAFRKYRVGHSIFGTEWVGLKYFNLFITSPQFWTAFMNTLILNVLGLVITFPLPIIFAILLNEISNNFAKRFVQTISYLPKFISTVVAVGMVQTLLSPSMGAVNKLLEQLFHIEPIFFINEPAWFRPICISMDIWQYMGWNAIIYIAALSQVDLEQYEAAMLDGANRFQQTIHITLPGISQTIVIVLILAVGYILSVGFEKVLLLQTPMNMVVSDVIATFVYRMGILNNNFSYATAVGLFNSVIAFIMIFSANAVARKLSDISLF